MGRRATPALMALLLLLPVLYAADRPQLLTTVPLSDDVSSGTQVPLDPHALVLVEVHVAKGDTLWKFAKRYLSRPQYYAQFLVYNHIKNPNRIYPGQALWVPLGPLKDHPEIFSGRPVPRWVLLRSDLPAVPSASSPSRTVAPVQPGAAEVETNPPTVEKLSPSEPQTAPPAKAPLPPVPDPVQAEFEQNLDLFNRGDYSTAAGRFESFLAKYPDSPLRVKAQYYLAESYRLLEQEP